MALVVRVLDAYLTHDTELLTKMDPYVNLQFGSELKQSGVCRMANRTPFWGETFVFTLQTVYALKVQVWDKETLLPDDLIGQGILNLAPILRSPPGVQTTQTIHLFYKGRSAGTINLSIVVQGAIANSGPVGFTYQQWTYQPQLDLNPNAGIQPGWGMGW